MSRSEQSPVSNEATTSRTTDARGRVIERQKTRFGIDMFYLITVDEQGNETRTPLLHEALDVAQAEVNAAFPPLNGAILNVIVGATERSNR